MIRFSPLAVALGAGLTLGFAGASHGQVSDFSIDFEAPGFNAADTGAIGAAGFDFFFSSSGGGAPGFPDFNGFQAGAPSLTSGSSASILTTAFAPDAIAGSQSLVFFADVNSGLWQDDPNVNADPRVLSLNVFQQQNITAADIGKVVTYDFLFSGAPAAVNTDSSTVVEAFMVTLDPNANFAATNEVAFDLSVAAQGQVLSGSLTLDLSAPALDGQILQFGFRNSFADGQNPAVVLDNLSLTVGAIPEPASLMLFGIGGLMIAGRRRRSVTASEH